MISKTSKDSTSILCDLHSIVMKNIYPVSGVMFIDVKWIPPCQFKNSSSFRNSNVLNVRFDGRGKY